MSRMVAWEDLKVGDICYFGAGYCKYLIIGNSSGKISYIKWLVNGGC